MKKILSIALAVLMLMTVCLGVTSCTTETVSAYTLTRDHIKEKVGLNTSMAVTSTDSSVVVFLFVETTETEDGEEEVAYLSAQATVSTVAYRIDLRLPENGSASTEWFYRYINTSTGETIAEGQSTLNLHDYTGDDLIALDSVSGITAATDYTHRINASALTNTALLSFDNYCHETLNISVTDFGFTSLSEKYLHTDTEAETEADLGGPLSGDRWVYAGRMTLLGMGMVFAVLALLWLVLIVFKNIFAQDPEKKAAKEKKDAPAAPAAVPAPAAPVEMNDGELVAAITAAVAAMIESDPALSAQFAGGFRVVSFKKKSGKTAWNR